MKLSHRLYPMQNILNSLKKSSHHFSPLAKENESKTIAMYKFTQEPVLFESPVKTPDNRIAIDRVRFGYDSNFHLFNLSPAVCMQISQNETLFIPRNKQE